MFSWLIPSKQTTPRYVNGAVVSAAVSSNQAREIQQVLDDRKLWPGIRMAPNAFDLIYIDPQTGAKLYLGGIAGLQDRKFVKQIDATVSVIDNERFPIEYIEQYVDEDKGLFYAALDDDDRENISRYFDRSANFIDYHMNKGLNVYVHCVAGMSRSSTIVANWLMRRHTLSALDALMLIKSRRPIVRPNDGFIRQLTSPR